MLSSWDRCANCTIRFHPRGPDGTHRSLVLQPMAMSVSDMMSLNPGHSICFCSNVVPGGLGRLISCTLRPKLFTRVDLLNFGCVDMLPNGSLDLKPDYLMLGLEDKSMLARFAAAELNDLVLRKMIDETRVIYLSRTIAKPRKGASLFRPMRLP
ncbi:hypothetical protein VTN31DRAFT_5279 [Thermomyces dupontii]|uniref:uncharacterized protein n=1 Tax=Talaromyces thermophilus TaxID=28565 RepID=UPI00374420DC